MLFCEAYWLSQKDFSCTDEPFAPNLIVHTGIPARGWNNEKRGRPSILVDIMDYVFCFVQKFTQMSSQSGL